MRDSIWTIFLLVLFGACDNKTPDVAAERKAAAERYFRGVYECESSVVNELAADSIVVSYPFFESRFGTPALRGREAVKNLAEGFCSRWIDGETTIDEAVYSAESVMMVWSFRAKNGMPGEDGTPPTFEETEWGGITLIRFDEAGKIVLELGEESTPGPYRRLK